MCTDKVFICTRGIRFVGTYLLDVTMNPPHGQGLCGFAASSLIEFPSLFFFPNFNYSDEHGDRPRPLARDSGVKCHGLGLFLNSCDT